MLLKKNNKPSYKEVAVPIDSEIALNLHKQEEADRLEKERVKKLTLEINERQEEEDLNDTIAQVRAGKVDLVRLIRIVLSREMSMP